MASKSTICTGPEGVEGDVHAGGYDVGDVDDEASGTERKDRAAAGCTSIMFTKEGSQSISITFVAATAICIRAPLEPADS